MHNNCALLFLNYIYVNIKLIILQKLDKTDKICYNLYVIDKGVLLMKSYCLDYINENEFKKLERALKKYNMLA